MSGVVREQALLALGPPVALHQAIGVWVGLNGALQLNGELLLHLILPDLLSRRHLEHLRWDCLLVILLWQLLPQVQLMLHTKFQQLQNQSCQSQQQQPTDSVGSES